VHTLQLKKLASATEADEDDFADFDLGDGDDDAFGSTIKGLPQTLLFAGGSGSPDTPKAARTTITMGNMSNTGTISNMGTISSSGSLRSITATVMGQGPTGVGTITRLGSKAAAPNLAVGSVRARARAIEKQWEADVDFGTIGAIGTGNGNGGSSNAMRLKLPVLAPAKKAAMPDANALDDLDDLDFDDDDQATLKAGATLKAMLPPPRIRNGSGGGTIKASKSAPVIVRPADIPAEDLETDLVLPLNLRNLTLATQSQPRAVRPRQSMSSVATDWDSPSTSNSAGRFSWGDESARHGRNSETSMTSLSDGGPPEKKDDACDDEEDDYEADLVIPSFFASRQTAVLNQLLDKKRKQQFAPPPPQKLQLDTVHGGDDSFEDGLVFDNPRTDLSHKRLEKNRRMRTVTVPVPFTLGADRKGKAPAVAAALGRQSPSAPPVPPIPRETASLGRATGRTLSAGSASGRETRSRPTSPLILMREQPARAPSRNRNRIPASYMSPPPVPPVPTTTPSRLEPNTPSRLRHQKSFHHLPPPPSPTLVRKQSLASLQDAIAAGHVRPESELGHYDARHKPGGSRLTQPTTSSLAKMRPPLPPAAAQLRPTRVRQMEMTRRTRHWGDGTELEGIEDLRVDPPTRSITPSYPKLGRKSLDKSPAAPTKDTEPRKKSGSKPRRQRQPAMLIKNLGAVDKKKVVGEMTWNPQTLRWEGNEAVLRDFDTVASSARPALITHFSGAGTSAPHSPQAGGGAVRIVGDMKFDPEKMCWVSLLPPGEDEPDPFEGMADDEDDLGAGMARGWASGGSGTLTRASGKLVSIGIGASAPSSTRFVSESGISIATTAASWEDRRLPPAGAEVPPELVAECREAEERHRREMRGWTLRPAQSASDLRDRERREEKRLWELRKLALRT
jgi:hypothetical protein